MYIRMLSVGHGADIQHIYEPAMKPFTKFVGLALSLHFRECSANVLGILQGSSGNLLGCKLKNPFNARNNMTRQSWSD